ncbi:MAG TPA: methenyltetrahydromethanopterin cyclohydrolase [Alphaproteobacteria bacterium]|nr:methenyltetrahydromethanopterin cyclohydrolase [Alphaproteobacteria bacterium]
MAESNDTLSLNRLAAPLVTSLLDAAAVLRIEVTRDSCGAILVDGGIAARGGVEAGRRIAEICLGGLGLVAIGSGDIWPWMITVTASNPVLACLGSQYAGWSLKSDDKEDKFFALGSGPGRSLAAKEALFQELGYRDRAQDAVLVLEVDRPPPSALLGRIATDCGVDPKRLTIIMTPTQSLAGCVQIAARSLEVALHKAHYLHFPLERIADGVGAAPLPPPGQDFLSAMGRTNDAILYGGSVQLFVDGPEADALELATNLPSSASRDYGRPFAEVFSSYKGDFYQIDPLLFSPGLVQVTALSTGRTFRRGILDPALLRRSFALAEG